jgi:REP element-mobilizing transposase RayT
MTDVQTIGFRRRHLPHWTVADRSYFVTIRLKGSLPLAVVEELKRERATFLTSNPDDEARNDFALGRFARVEAILDAAGCGDRFLETFAIAQLVIDAFVWLESNRGWAVNALTVMPNHVHVLMRNERGENHRLNEHLGVLKGYTAREANRVLNRQGAFWMDENFDHWCRSDGERAGYAEYIRQNPVKAHLVMRPQDWPWTRAK